MTGELDEDPFHTNVPAGEAALVLSDKYSLRPSSETAIINMNQEIPELIKPSKVKVCITLIGRLEKSNSLNILRSNPGCLHD